MKSNLHPNFCVIISFTETKAMVKKSEQTVVMEVG